MKSPLSLAMIGLLAASAATPSFSQSYADREYQQQLRDYERQRAEYEQAQRDYERRYGRAAPYQGYDNRAYDNRGYDNRGYSDNRGYNGRFREYADSPCERDARRDSNNAAAGTAIGALVGAVIGNKLANDKHEGAGTVLGAVVGGALGNSIANNANDAKRYAAQCDARGYYYTYEQTYPYREDTSYRGQRSGRYNVSDYNRMRCRLAIAPAEYSGRSDYVYVRVCPDRDNRYRITS